MAPTLVPNLKYSQKVYMQIKKSFYKNAWLEILKLSGLISVKCGYHIYIYCIIYYISMSKKGQASKKIHLQVQQSLYKNPLPQFWFQILK